MFFNSLTWSAYQIIIISWIAIAAVVFIVLRSITAPYGRHSSSRWGAMISNKWGWIIMEMPVLLVLWFFIIPERYSIQISSWVMISLFSLHYINRIFIFPFRIRTKGKKMPLMIVGSAVFFNLVNGFLFGVYFTSFADYSINWLGDIRFISGAIIFFCGMYINWKADDLLIHLRTQGETGYKIPRGWLFEKISCPNLFGEIIEWFGFAILCWNLPAFTFFIWTAANLIPRAISHHKWYKEKFSDYPADRKAIFPGWL